MCYPKQSEEQRGKFSNGEFSTGVQTAGVDGTKTIQVRVNGRIVEKQVPIRMLLVDFLREELGFTGTHVGCSVEGRCGACTWC